MRFVQLFGVYGGVIFLGGGVLGGGSILSIYPLIFHFSSFWIVVASFYSGNFLLGYVHHLRYKGKIRTGFVTDIW